MKEAVGRTSRRGWCAALAGGVMCLSGGAAGADTLDWGISVGATHSDNFNRSATDPTDDTRGEIGLDLQYAREGGRLNARVNTDLQYRSYFDDTYSDELFGNFDALATYWFIPDRLSWVVENNFGQTLIDRSSVDTPDNRQNTNIFSTGPDIKFMLGDRTSLLLQGRWSDVSYETSDSSHQRLEGNVGLRRHLGPRTLLSLNASAARYDFDDPAIPSDYDRQSAYLGFETRGARTTLRLQGGYTTVNYFGQDIDGPLLDLSISRETSARSRLTLRAGTELTDSADLFRLDREINQDTDAGDVVTDVQVSTEPFQSDFAFLGWTLSGERNTLGLSANWRNEDYTVDDSQNRESFVAGATFSRNLTPALTGRLFGFWRSEDFANADADYDENWFGIGLNWGFTEQFSLGMDVTRFEGTDRTTLEAAPRDYVENRYSLRVTYRPAR